QLLNMKKNPLVTFVHYSKCLSEVTLDVAKEFDAYPIAKFEELLNTAFSQEEIRTLGKKYGFDIPVRLKKDDLLQYVREMMKARRKLTLVLQRELKDMTIVQLNTFCQLQNLGISSSMKKDELIHLLMFMIKQAKFPTIQAPNILGFSFTEPLKFRVDLDVVDNFKRGKAKKVIYLEEDDKKIVEDMEDLIIETPKKRPTKDDMISEIIKKLLPYLNIDEETAQMAIRYGIDVKPQPKKSSSVQQKKKSR
ncbi:MAG: hypothetical protein K2I42_03570, partial [Anaeroplasmataceae bacterium]|nr:hypothetical protein [Anaeroplasmataceae bacterium]